MTEHICLFLLKCQQKILHSKILNNKIELQYKITTGQTGPSYTAIVTERYFVVRQGYVLMIYDLKTLQMLQQCFLRNKYISNPCSVYMNAFYEISDNAFVIVDLRTFDLFEQKHNLDFKNSTFLNFDSVILINTNGRIITLNLKNFKVTKIVTIDEQYKEMMIMGQNFIATLGIDDMVIIDTFTLELQYIKKARFFCSNILKIGNDNQVAFGIVDENNIATSTKQILLFTGWYDQQMVFQSDGSILNCTPITCDSTCIITDQNGNILIMESDIFKEIKQNQHLINITGTFEEQKHDLPNIIQKQSNLTINPTDQNDAEISIDVVIEDIEKDENNQDNSCQILNQYDYEKQKQQQRIAGPTIQDKIQFYSNQ